MKTASFLNFHMDTMNRDYLRATASERTYAFAPLDFGSIDAPEVMPAGSVYCWESSINPGVYTDLARGVMRGMQ